MFTFDHAWGAILTLFTIVLGWLHLSHRREIDDLKTASEKAQKSADDVAGSLAKHQLFAAENYTRKPDVDRAFEKLEERLGERLDEIRDEIRELKKQPPSRTN